MKKKISPLRNFLFSKQKIFFGVKKIIKKIWGIFTKFEVGYGFASCPHKALK